MRTYIVLFGNQKYNPEGWFQVSRHKFNTLKEAREYAKDYWNAHLYSCDWNGSMWDYHELKIVCKKKNK